jgi:Flp pilus assembly protein TadG
VKRQACILGHKQRGAAALEFVLLVVPLLMLLTAVVELGRLMYTYECLLSDARGAARILSRTSPSDASYAAVKTQAACLVVSGSPDCSASRRIAAVGPDRVQICDALSCPSTHSHARAGSASLDLVTVTLGSVNAPVEIPALTSMLPALLGLQSFVIAPISVTLRQAG